MSLATAVDAISTSEEAEYRQWSSIRPIYWALKFHRNIRNERMRFRRGTNYLWDLYNIIDRLPHMVVEKSVQCFPPGTKVTTPNGYRNIEDIRVGDLVLTHKGRYRSVTRVFSREFAGDLVQKRADLMPYIRSTGKHPFLSYPYSREKYHHSRAGQVFGKGPIWIDAVRVKDGDFVARAKVPRSTGNFVELDLESLEYRPKKTDGEWFKEKWGQKYTKSRISLVYGFGQLVGLYLAGGWIDTDKLGRSRKLCFGFHINESNLEKIVRDEIQKLYIGKAPIHIYTGGGNNCRSVVISSPPLAIAFSFLFGRGDENKALPVEWLNEAPSDFLKGVLDGAFLGDGSRGKTSQSNFRSTSGVLVDQVRFIASMFGIYGVIRKEFPIGKNPVYSFVYSDSGRRSYTRIQDIHPHHVASRVKKTTVVPYDGQVYNIEVAEDHSYVAEDYVVHNCGLSELFIIQSHLEAAERGMSIMYVLPKYELRNRFVNNRIYKLHRRVTHYKNMVKIANTKVHRTSLMHFGHGTLAYVGSNVQDEFIEIPVDSAFVDEVDRCNLSNLLMLPDRLTASPYQFQREISNPTVEGFGIDERYSESSMGEWKIKCPRCGAWFTPDFFQHVVRETSANVFVPRDPKTDPDPLSKAEINLIHDCGSPVDRLGRGEWVHAHPDREWQGFRVSKLVAKLSPKSTLRSLYTSWSKAVGNDLKTQVFYNSDLGLPFSSKGAKITRFMLDECIRNYGYPPKTVSREKRRFLGVDVGKDLHAIMRERDRSGEMRLIGAWVLPGFTQLGQIMREWKPNCTVIDAMPEIHKVMEIKDDFSNVWSSRFQESATALAKNDHKREVTMNRTALMDYVRQGFELQQLINPLRAEFLEEGEYYAHLLAPTRILETNEEHPEKSRFVWKEGSRPDHFFLAEAYCLQAGMIMPDHGIFDFFKSESTALTEHADKRSVTGGNLSDEERQRIADLQGLTPEVAMVQIREMNAPKIEKPKVDDERIRDTIDMLFRSQGYVDLHLASEMSEEHEGDVTRVLLLQGFKVSRIAGQYTKGGG